MTARTLLIVAAALPLAACLSFGPKVPDTLLALRADASLPAGPARTARSGQTVVVGVPTATQELATTRVAVRSGATSVAYLKDAQWLDVPNRLFRELLGETISARTTRVVLDPRQAALAPGMRLGGRLSGFGLDAPSRSVIVTYDATLARGEGQPVEARRFEARVPVADETPATVGTALNQAANQVAGEVAEWIG